MIKNVQPLSSLEFNKGLVTRSDILRNDLNQSPNTMDVQWKFDASLHKRLGYSSTNTLIIGSTALAGWTIDSSGTLSTNLISYWKLDDPSQPWTDQVATNNLVNTYGTTPNTITGIRNQAISFIAANSNSVYVANQSSLQTGNVNFSIGGWVYFNSLSNTPVVLAKRGASADYEYELSYDSSNAVIRFGVSSSGTAFTFVRATSFGAINTSTWYNFVAWHSNNAHIGISVNLSVTTAPYTGGVRAGSNNLVLGAADTANNQDFLWLDGRIDEVGFWKKILSVGERSDFFGGGTGNTYSGGASSSFSWAMFDFGASAIRWLTVACGTGIVASSNLGTTFVTISTSRTQNYQYFERSKNVLIATSDSYDTPLYWAGSAGTFASALAPGSAPAVKYSINYNGFLILLNSLARKRGFFYADENLQLTDPWTNSFDIPSSADDEITAAFILYKFLYISTRYKIYRIAFVGGNPDWSYLKIKDWGFVPRTAKLISLKGGQVVVGLDWNRRLRAFDGFDDLFVSDNVENDNNICDFAMEKVSYAGSGLLISHAEVDPLEQEYRLNVAIGATSTQTTHAILLNGRTLALYPYANQNFQCMCVAESNNQQYLMAADRSGFVHILNSGNLDGARPVNDMYDSPPLFSNVPEGVAKGRNANVFFSPVSCGTIYYQDRIDLSNVWSPMKPLSNSKGETEIKGTEPVIRVVRTIDIPATYNTLQFRITSSANTAVPWELNRLDLLQQGLGIGKGG